MARKQKPNQPKFKRTDLSAACLDAALDMAAKSGWNSVSIEKIARRLKKSLPAVKAAFPDKTSLVTGLLKKIDAETGRRYRQTQVSGRGNERDRLFDILMTRVDIVQSNRAGFVSIFGSYRKNLPDAFALVQPMHQSMSSVIALADVEKTVATHARPSLQSWVLLGVYVSVMAVWAEDETRDLSKTMAALDKRLELFEKATGYMSCGSVL